MINNWFQTLPRAVQGYLETWIDFFFNFFYFIFFIAFFKILAFLKKYLNVKNRFVCLEKSYERLLRVSIRFLFYSLEEGVEGELSAAHIRCTQLWFFGGRLFLAVLHVSELFPFPILS